VTRWVILAGVILTFATAVVGAWQTWLNRQKIQEVHVLVNSQLSAVVARVDQLTKKLRDAGVDVPGKPGERE
jgi:hypothetical protein